MLKFFMRHNAFAIMFDKDGGDGNGAGGGKSTDGAGDTTVTEPGSDTTKTGGDNSEPALPKTAEELSKLVQSESDKRVSQALKTAREENQKAIKAAVDEALENEKLTQKERDEKARKKELDEIERGKREVAEGNRKLLIVDKMTEMKVPDVVMAMRNSITSQDEDGIVSEVKGLVGIYEAGKAAAKQELLANKGSDVPGQQLPGEDSSEAGIQAEYNALMAKSSLTNVEQRRLNELAVKVKAMKSAK